jgi:hypothetical protein
MASDCKSDGLVPTQVQILSCPIWMVCGCSSTVERLPSKQAVGGSIPLTRFMDDNAMRCCGRCHIEKALSEFTPKGRGRQSYCRSCVSEYFQEYYRKNKAAYIGRAVCCHDKMRDVLRQAKNKPCADCGNSYPYYVMDFDHREGEKKVCNVSALHSHRRVSMRRLLEELAKCDAVCANCHRERTHRRKQYTAGRDKTSIPIAAVAQR